MTDTAEIYYDPFDFEIDADPYPIWKRMRDEQPLYHNEKYDFYALSRFEDVENGLKDYRTYISGKGTLLELIKSGAQLPIGMVIFEDPPTHDVYRGLLSRVFTPKKMAALEPQIRQLCRDLLDGLAGAGEFDMIKQFGAIMPMRVIGMLLGIPESDQQVLRDKIDDGLKLESGEMPTGDELSQRAAAVQTGEFVDYITWRERNPSDDLMTDLLNAEFDDHTGERRRLRRDEVLGYCRLLASAGNETTTRLIGWTTKLLADNPGERRRLVENPALIPSAIEEVLRYETPTPALSRYVTRDVHIHGGVVPAGSAMVMLTASGNRDERKFPDADRFDVGRRIDHHVAFGYGIHFCMGASLARIEGRVALDELLRRFPEWDVDLSRSSQARTTTVRGWEHLMVTIP